MHVYQPVHHLMFCLDFNEWDIKTSSSQGLLNVLICLQDVFLDKPVSLHSYTYDRYHVFTDFQLLWVCVTNTGADYVILFNFFFFAVSTLMWPQVRKRAMATKACQVVGRGTENHENTIASLHARVPDRKRPASPNLACSMWVVTKPKKKKPETNSVFVMVKRDTVPAGLQHWW